MIDFLKRIHARVTADSESATKAEGYLSYRAEWHAAAWGFAAVFIAVLTGRLEVAWGAIGWTITAAGDRKVPGYVPYKRQLMKESAYVLGHGVAGAVVAIGARGLLVLAGVDIPPIPVF